MRIEINTDNAAFQDGNADAEIRRIIDTALTRHAGLLLGDEDPAQRHKLRDVNGNAVGFIEY